MLLAARPKPSVCAITRIPYIPGCKSPRHRTPDCNSPTGIGRVSSNSLSSSSKTCSSYESASTASGGLSTVTGNWMPASCMFHSMTDGASFEIVIRGAMIRIVCVTSAECLPPAPSSTQSQNVSVLSVRTVRPFRQQRDRERLIEVAVLPWKSGSLTKKGPVEGERIPIRIRGCTTIEREIFFEAVPGPTSNVRHSPALASGAWFLRTKMWSTSEVLAPYLSVRLSRNR